MTDEEVILSTKYSAKLDAVILDSFMKTLGIMTAERQRLQSDRDALQEPVYWKRWRPYLSERQWGTVREDYSDTGLAWEYFSHAQSGARAYRWGEDGIGGICDDYLRYATRTTVVMFCDWIVEPSRSDSQRAAIWVNGNSRESRRRCERILFLSR
jgi:hypothetical protein